jgi:DNA-binding transcriptional ArsR family regulator
MLASFLRVLEDPARLHILRFLCEGEHTARECATAAGLPETSVRGHLRCLTDRGYLASRRVATDIRYSVTDSRTAELVQISRDLADDNQYAVGS